MAAIPEHICPPGSLSDARRAAPELMKAFIIRSNFIPGLRHRLGWRGIKDCFHDVEAWTAKIGNLPGVFGIRCEEVVISDGVSGGRFLLSYFPHPEEDLVESFSVQAGIISQEDDYISRVREYLKHEDLRQGFTLGRISLDVASDASGFSLTLQAPTRLITIAEDGLSVVKDGEAVQLVEPGGRDQDLPAWDIAMEFFRVLAASVVFCLRNRPDSMVRYCRDGIVAGYNAKELTSLKAAPELKELCLGLGFERHPQVPDSRAAEPAWLSEPQHHWEKDGEIPEEYASEPWWDVTPFGECNNIDKEGLGITDKPRLIVLSGFLGSGKTSFLRHFIEHQAARNQFVAVVQNEIGETGLDGKLLGQNYAVTEVDEGCVCCSLVGSLKGAVMDIMSSFQPDDIVVETTGLANPGNLLAEISEIEDIVSFESVTTIVDAEAGLESLEKFEVARAQATTADVIVVNKADLVDKERLAELEQAIRRFNPHAPVIIAEHGDVHPGLLYDVDNAGAKAGKKAAPLFLGDLRNHSHDHMSSVSIPVPESFDRKWFEQRVGMLPENVFRLKGMVRFDNDSAPSVVQWVAGRCEITPADPDIGETPLFLVAIGKDMEQINAVNLFR